MRMLDRACWRVRPMAGSTRAVDVGAGDAVEHGLFQAVAQSCEPLVFRRRVFQNPLRGAAQANRAGDILGAGAPAALMMAAEEDRRDARALAHEQSTGSLRPIELMRRD